MKKMEKNQQIKIWLFEKIYEIDEHSSNTNCENWAENRHTILIQGMQRWFYYKFIDQKI